jgi:hypothetical protein
MSRAIPVSSGQVSNIVSSSRAALTMFAPASASNSK